MRKGQILTVEQLLIFSMGIIILVSITLAINSTNTRISSVSYEKQFREVGELTLSHITYVYSNGKNSNVNTQTSFSIPITLSSQAYRLNLTNSSIIVTSLVTSSQNVTIPLSNINYSVYFAGSAISTKGSAKINYDVSSNTIILSDT